MSSSSEKNIIFPKDFYKYVLEKRNLKVALYDSGIKYLDKVLYFIVEFMNNSCAHKFNMTENDVKENIMYFFQTSLDSEKNPEIKSKLQFQLDQSIIAGFARMDEKEELANDIPEIFTRISCVKTGMQFYLSAIMEIAYYIFQDCHDKEFTLTEKNLKSIPLVNLICRSKTASISGC